MLLIRIMSKKQMDIIEAADFVGISATSAKQVLLQMTRPTDNSIGKDPKYQQKQQRTTAETPRNESSI